MVDKVIKPEPNVIDFLTFQQERKESAGKAIASKAAALSARGCRHCGAALLDGESDDDCSSAGLNAPVLRAPPSLRVLTRRFYAE